MKIRALDRLEITIPVPKEDRRRLGRKVTILHLEKGEDGDVPPETAEKLVKAKLAEKA